MKVNYPFDALHRSMLLDLISATEGRDSEEVFALLERGVRPDLIDTHSGWSGLHAAVLFHLEALPIMLRHCANPDLPQVCGGTALSYVIHELAKSPAPERREALITGLRCLLEAGANPRTGGADQTPLHLVRLYELKDIEPLLTLGSSELL